jgi:CRP-like cAMP-binding protein
MNDLKTYLERFIPFSESEMARITSLFSEVTLKKNDYFAKAGAYPSQLGFVSKGILRAFFRNHAGHEYNKTFFMPFGFVAPYASLLTKEENSINIQCLTNCTLLVADYNKLTALYEEIPKLERVARMMAEYKFALKEKREIELVTLDASQRYAIFREEHPSLENQINQYHIASYLGITPTQLSRIRAKR